MYFQNAVPKELITSHLKLQKMLVEYLNERFNRLLSNIGHLFTESLKSLLLPYREYAQNYPDSLLVWSKRFEDNPSTKALIEQICTETGFTLVDVHGFLIKPVQRISSFYITVLEELNKGCGNTLLLKVVANMRKMAVQVNEATPIVNFDYSTLYLPSLEGGYIEKRVRANWVTRFMQIHWESKMIAYSLNERKEKKKTVPFENITHCESVKERENVFVIQTKDIAYFFQTPNPTQKDLWIWAIGDIIRQNHNTT